MVGSAWPQRSEREAPGISENWFLGGGRLACEKCPKFTISLHVLNVALKTTVKVFSIQCCRRGHQNRL